MYYQYYHLIVSTLNIDYNNYIIRLNEDQLILLLYIDHYNNIIYYKKKHYHVDISKLV